MGRPPRIHIEEGLYYVISRGIYGYKLFLDNRDVAVYLDIVMKAKEQYPFRLFSFVLLPGSTHLLIQPYPEVTISKILQAINPNYTKDFNARYNRKGSLFSERFRATLIEKERYLKELVRHIHLIPKRARLVSDLKDHPWSSYGIYLGVSSFGLKVEIEKDGVLKEFNRLEDFISYHDNFNEAELKDLEKGIKQARIALGSQEYIRSVEEQLQQQKRQLQKVKKIPKKIVYLKILSPIALIFLLITGLILRFYYKESKELDKRLEEERTKTQDLISEETEKVKQDLDEKYRADMVSFEAMKKRLDIEKKKRRELEEKLPPK